MSATTIAIPSGASKALHVTLWGVQVLLAVAFGLAGTMKATQPIADVIANTGLPAAFPVALVRFIGISELAGALGLILPAATRVLPGLTPLAAAGLAVVMTLASGFHIARGEFAALPVTVGLGLLAAFVVWGRTKKVSILAR